MGEHGSGEAMAALAEATAIQMEVAHQRLAFMWTQMVFDQLLEVWSHIEDHETLAYEDKVGIQVGLLHSGIQLDTTQYPAWANHPCASWLVIAASASARACSKASSVRAALVRKSVLTLDQHSSMGEKSGEYGGR